MPIALITGAARRLGAEDARQLAAIGVEVVIAGRDRDAVAATASELEGARPYPASLDVADPVSVSQAARSWPAGFGPLDILINNAAAYVDWSEMASSADLETAKQVMEVTCSAAGG